MIILNFISAFMVQHTPITIRLQPLSIGAYIYLAYIYIYTQSTCCKLLQTQFELHLLESLGASTSEHVNHHRWSTVNEKLVKSTPATRASQIIRRCHQMQPDTRNRTITEPLVFGSVFPFLIRIQSWQNVKMCFDD